MTITYHNDLLQGSDEWLAARCGLLTASEMKHIITPAKLQYASNDKERSHLYELVAQRITGFVEPSYIGDDMIRGMADEQEAKQKYAEKYAPVTDCGFITNDKWGFTLGCSPDGLVGDDGQVECKSRRQKYQIESIIGGEMPNEYALQVQTALLVSERKWVDFISYSGGLPMMTVRIYPDHLVQTAIIAAASTFHKKMDEMMTRYKEQLNSPQMRLVATERKLIEEIY